MKYPIYFFSASWTQDEKIPGERTKNMTSSHGMFRQEIDDPLEEAFKWWDKMDKTKFINIDDLTIDGQFERYDTWCLTWFSHFTFDIGQSDAEVLHSFQEYVDEKLDLNRKNGKLVNGYWQEPFCLMGAEDRWRWCGAEPDGSKPPCRCKFCKEQGVIRIGH